MLLNNKERITIAKIALLELPEFDTIETGIIDLIANLLHLADSKGLDTAAILRMAEGNFNEERERKPRYLFDSQCGKVSC
jgi:hypothetical protein